MLMACTAVEFCRASLGSSSEISLLVFVDVACKSRTGDVRFTEFV